MPTAGLQSNIITASLNQSNSLTMPTTWDMEPTLPYTTPMLLEYSKHFLFMLHPNNTFHLHCLTNAIIRDFS